MLLHEATQAQSFSKPVITLHILDDYSKKIDHFLIRLRANVTQFDSKSTHSLESCTRHINWIRIHRNPVRVKRDNNSCYMIIIHFGLHKY